jgi:ribose transport system permease protein
VSTLLGVLERYALLWLLILLVIVFSILPSTSDTFLTSANIKNIVAQESVIAILALAALIPLVALQFDVSVGAVLGAVAILMAKLTVEHGWPVVPALVAGIALGCCVGLVNGYVVAYIGANSFIITLGMATLLAGLVSLYSKDQTTVNVPHSLLDFGNGYWLGVPRPTWLLAVVALTAAYVLRHTVFGRQLVQIGSNPRSARLVGIRVERLMLLAFVLAGALAAVAGALQLARTGSGNPQVGSNLTLSALAACFLGATVVRPGQFNVPGTLIGVFFVAVSVNGLTLAGAADWVDPVLNGAAVVIAVALSTVLGRRRGTRTAVF